MERQQAGDPKVVSVEAVEAEQDEGARNKIAENKILRREIARLEQEVIDHYNELGREGERAVKSSDKRQRDFNRSLTEALKNACLRWNAEIRVICRDLAEATFAWGVLNVAVKRAGLLDKEASREYQIELTNNSCILIKVEGE